MPPRQRLQYLPCLFFLVLLFLRWTRFPVENNVLRLLVECYPLMIISFIKQALHTSLFAASPQCEHCFISPIRPFSCSLIFGRSARNELIIPCFVPLYFCSKSLSISCT